MLIIEFVGVVVLWYVALCIVQLYVEAIDRRDKKLMAIYQEQEEARLHAFNLAAIDRTVRATAAEMLRVAAEDSGEVIDATAIEVKR